MAVSINVFAVIIPMLSFIYLFIVLCVPAGYALESQTFLKQFNWKTGSCKTEMGNGIQRVFGVH